MMNKRYEQELLFGCNSQASLKRRALARLMNEAEIEKEKIAVVIGVSERQIYNYVQNKEDIDKYEDKRYRPTSDMSEFEDKILSAFTEKPPATAKEAAKRIEEITGLKRSPTQVRKFMHKLGLKPLRTAQIPAKANPDAQKRFLAEELEPRIEKAKDKKQVLLFIL